MHLQEEELTAWQTDDQTDSDYQMRQEKRITDVHSVRQRRDSRYNSDMAHYRRVGKIDSEVMFCLGFDISTFECLCTICYSMHFS